MKTIYFLCLWLSPLFLIAALGEGWLITRMSSELTRQATIANANQNFYRLCAKEKKLPLSPMMTNFHHGVDEPLKDK